MITELECRSGLRPEFGFCLSRIQSQKFRFEAEQDPESTLRSVLESVKIRDNKISVMMLVVVKVMEIT